MTFEQVKLWLKITGEILLMISIITFLIVMILGGISVFNHPINDVKALHLLLAYMFIRLVTR